MAAGQPAPEQAHITRGRELAAKGDGAAAVEQLRRAAELNPKLPRVHREIGVLLLERRDFAGAAVAFEQASLLDPSDIDSRYNHAMAVANGGERQRAVALLEKLVAERPAFALAHFGLGHVLADLGDNVRAEANLRMAVRAGPAIPRAWFELARLLERKGDGPGAARSYREAIARKPDFAAARYRLATLLKASGDEAGARAEIDQVKKLTALRAGGERAGKAYLAALALLDQGRAGDAVSELEQARAARPDFEEIGGALAVAYVEWAVEAERAGEVTSAVERFSKALAIEPNAETENHVGVLLARVGRMEEAIARFRSALALRPGYDSARRNLDRALSMPR